MFEKTDWAFDPKHLGRWTRARTLRALYPHSVSFAYKYIDKVVIQHHPSI